MEFFRRKLCGENLISCALCKKVNSVFLGIQKKKVLFRGFMVKKRYFNFRYLPFPPKEFNFSNLAGHGAFIFLALSYMENDFLNLRLYAMSGITLSILFQYYRERPLWIPIRWNTLFLLINLGMVGAILKKEYDSRHLPLDQKELYIKVFKPSGLSYIDFCFLMSHAEKRTFKAGDVIVREGELHSSVFLVHQGTLEVNRKSMSSSIGKIYPMQFVGEMAFLRWENGCNQISSEDYSFFQPIWDTFSVLSSSVVNVGVQVASSIGLKDWLPWLPSPPFDNTERNRLVTDGTFKLNGLQDKDVHHSDGMDALDVTDSPRGALANSTVICDQECIMYCWKFEDLHDLMKKKPSIDRALERAISTDLNEKILARYSNENKLQYLQVLSAALFENEISFEKKEILDNFRQKHKISLADHYRLVRDLSWTSEQYDRGFKKFPASSVPMGTSSASSSCISTDKVPDSSHSVNSSNTSLRSTETTTLPNSSSNGSSATTTTTTTTMTMTMTTTDAVVKELLAPVECVDSSKSSSVSTTSTVDRWKRFQILERMIATRNRFLDHLAKNSGK